MRCVLRLGSCREVFQAFSKRDSHDEASAAPARWPGPQRIEQSWRGDAAAAATTATGAIGTGSSKARKRIKALWTPGLEHTRRHSPE